MNYETKLSLDKYDEYISIGNKCPTGIMIQKLGLRSNSYPFDWIPTQPYHILNYIKTNFEEFYPEPGKILNKENIWFGHHDFNNPETKLTLERRIKRLYDLFNSDKKTLFIYTSEADIYNEMKSRDNEKRNYDDIRNFSKYLKGIYPRFNFNILVINMNVYHENEENIYNATINVDSKYISDNMETHQSWCYEVYRDVLFNIMKQILT
jgi:hypothetical protein